MSAKECLMDIDTRLEIEKKSAEKDDVELEHIESEEEDYESSPAEYEIATYPADFTLEVLHDKWKKEEIIIPQFQRQFVWKQVQASKLIESFLLGLPVPPIFLYTERTTKKYLVIDGQQRLRSIVYFFEGYFGEEINGKKTVFSLKGLNEKSKWNGKRISDFDEVDQRELKGGILRAIIVKQIDPNDDTSLYHIFERLNAGGTPLTNQEVRNCVYGGKFNDLLIELNKHENWRKILGKPNPDSRQKDIELILRFFALYNTEEYNPSLKDYLSKFLKHNRSPKDEFLENERNLFKETCDFIVSKLGEKPFHVKAGLNAAVYDSVMVAFAKNLNDVSQIGDIKKNYNSLVKNPDFSKWTRSGTTSKAFVQGRFTLAETVLFGEVFVKKCLIPLLEGK
ncbi:MAG: DUF262 domain-containing protein [Candidatus Schekmanbacteria bacterium]|nr:DUF262 domain-containing protein [Candidatus Schekmanbacteria bacterium]